MRKKCVEVFCAITLFLRFLYKMMGLFGISIKIFNFALSLYLSSG